MMLPEFEPQTLYLNVGLRVVNTKFVILLFNSSSSLSFKLSDLQKVGTISLLFFDSSRNLLYFSLGGVTWRMLTGDTPAVGSSRRLRRRRRRRRLLLHSWRNVLAANTVSTSTFYVFK